jgi:methylglyoxal reductase
LVIAWTFSQPGVACVLCGARDPQQARENAAAGAITLSPEEVESIGAAVHA